MKVQLPGDTARENYQAGFAVSFHNDVANTPGGTAIGGLEGYSPSIAFTFEPFTNTIKVNTDGFGWAQASSTAVPSGVNIYGDVYLWIDLVRTTHQFRVFISNSSSKPTTAAVTYTHGSALATYFSNQVYLTFGSLSQFVADAGNERSFEFETFKFVTAAAGTLPDFGGDPDPDPDPNPVSGTAQGINPTTGDRIPFPFGAKKRVYWIGNSVTDGVKYQAVDSIASAEGYDHIWGRHMIPGAPLDWLFTHPNDGFSEPPFGFPTTAFAAPPGGYQWDDITFQPFDRDLQSDREVINQYLDMVRKTPANLNNTRPYIYQRWFGKVRDPGQTAAGWNTQWLLPYDDPSLPPDNATKDFSERLVDLIRADNPDLAPALLIPIGEVFHQLNIKMAAGQIPGYTSIWQVYEDGIHPTPTGCYIATCTAYATLYWKDPRGTTVPTASGAVDPSIVAAIQQTVYEVVFSYEYAGFDLGESTGGNPDPVNRPPVAVITANVLSGVAPLTVNFTGANSYDLDTGDSVVVFDWNFGNGNTSAQVSSTQIYSTPGTYNVTLRVQDENGAFSTTVTRQIVVSASPGNGTSTFLTSAQEDEFTALSTALGKTKTETISLALDLAEGLYKVADAMQELT